MTVTQFSEHSRFSLTKCEYPVPVHVPLPLPLPDPIPSPYSAPKQLQLEFLLHFN